MPSLSAKDGRADSSALADTLEWDGSPLSMTWIQDGLVITAKLVADQDYDPNSWADPYDPESPARVAEEQRQLEAGELVAYGVCVEAVLDLGLRVASPVLGRDSLWGVTVTSSEDESVSADTTHARRHEYLREVALTCAENAIMEARETITRIKRFA